MRSLRSLWTQRTAIRGLTMANIKTTSHTETYTIITLDRVDIIDFIREHHDAEIPQDAKVFVRVPGGGDWSNTDLDIDPDTHVQVRYVVEKQDPVRPTRFSDSKTKLHEEPPFIACGEHGPECDGAH